MVAKKTAACKARSGAILVQPRVYPGLILEVNSGAGRWGPFPAYFTPQRLGQAPFLGRDFPGQRRDQLRLAAGGALVGN